MPRLKKAPDYIDPTGIESFRYWCDAKLVDVYDGDTLWMHCRLGFHCAMESVKFRLARIQAPEMDEEGGIESRDYLRSQLADQPIVLQSIKTRRGWAKKGGYGRYLAEIYVHGVNINNLMVEDKQATWYD